MMKNFLKLVGTYQILRLGARPDRSQLADSASLLRASGKPSTWFPLGGHVQKVFPNDFFRDETNNL